MAALHVRVSQKLHYGYSSERTTPLTSRVSFFSRASYGNSYNNLLKRNTAVRLLYSRILLDEEVQAGARHFRGGEWDIVRLFGPDRFDMQIAQ